MKHFLTLINVLLIAGVVYFGLQTYRRVTKPLQLVPVENIPVPLSVQEVKKRSSSVNSSAIIQRNLFNTETDNGPIPEKVDVGKLKPTKLNLKLWGTVTGSTMDPYAVIEEKGKKRQNLYRVGDVVQSANVKVILREKVVLNVDGKDEVLEIEKVTGRVSAQRPFAVAPQGIRGQPTSGKSPKVVPKSGVRNVTLDRGQLGAALENVNDLLTQVRIRPHFKNGKIDGLSVTGIKPNAIFRKMGLRNGDVITDINGESIGNVNDAIEMFQQLGDTDGVQIRIKRRGREQTFKYTVK